MNANSVLPQNLTEAEYQDMVLKGLINPRGDELFAMLAPFIR